MCHVATGDDAADEPDAAPRPDPPRPRPPPGTCHTGAPHPQTPGHPAATTSPQEPPPTPGRTPGPRETGDRRPGEYTGSRGYRRTRSRPAEPGEETPQPSSPVSPPHRISHISRSTIRRYVTHGYPILRSGRGRHRCRPPFRVGRARRAARHRLRIRRRFETTHPHRGGGLHAAGAAPRRGRGPSAVAFRRPVRTGAAVHVAGAVIPAGTRRAWRDDAHPTAKHRNGFGAQRPSRRVIPAGNGIRQPGHTGRSRAGLSVWWRQRMHGAHRGRVPPSVVGSGVPDSGACAVKMFPARRAVRCRHPVRDGHTRWHPETDPG